MQSSENFIDRAKNPDSFSAHASFRVAVERASSNIAAQHRLGKAARSPIWSEQCKAVPQKRALGLQLSGRRPCRSSSSFTAVERDNDQGANANCDIQHERRRASWLRRGSIDGRASPEASAGLPLVRLYVSL
jgi:hypothetical protein